MFVFMVAGELSRLGLDQACIARAVHSLPLLERDPETFEPLTTYSLPNEPACLVFVPIGTSKDFQVESHFVAKAALPRMLAALKTYSATIIDVGELAARIADAPEVDLF